jgi:hypothetical protein
VQEQGWLSPQLGHDRIDDITRPHEPRVCVPHLPFTLNAARAEPVIGQGKALTAVVVFEIVDSHRSPVAHVRHVLRNAVRHLGHDFGEVNRRVRVVPDSQKQYLSIELPHAADRALQTVRRQRQRIARYAHGVRSERREREGVGASNRARLTPERVGDNAKIFRGWRRLKEGPVSILGPRWHHHRAGRTHRA